MKKPDEKRRNFDRDTAIYWARGLYRRDDVLYMDTETNGMEEGSEILEIAFCDNGRIVGSYLIRPDSGLVDKTEIHGIEDRHMTYAFDLDLIAPHLIQMLRRNVIVCWNTWFEKRMLSTMLLDQYLAEKAEKMSLKELHISLTDAMEINAMYSGIWNEEKGKYRWHKLGDAFERAIRSVISEQTIGHPARVDAHAHSALGDALRTREIVHYIAESKAMYTPESYLDLCLEYGLHPLDYPVHPE